MENDSTTNTELLSEADRLLQALEAGIEESASISRHIVELNNDVEIFEKDMNTAEKTLEEFGQEKSKELEHMAGELQQEAAAEAREGE